MPEEIAALMVREPFSGMDPAVFARLTDAQIWGVYFRARDKNGRLIRRSRDESYSPPPSAEELKIPPEVWAELLTMTRPGKTATPQMDWILTFWQVELGRGKSVEETMQTYKEALICGD